MMRDRIAHEQLSILFILSLVDDIVSNDFKFVDENSFHIKERMSLL